MTPLFNPIQIYGPSGVSQQPESTFTSEQSPDSKGASRRKRLPSTYTNISNEDREELVRRVMENKEKIVEVAKELKLNYSTAKSILRVYKSEKRVVKIPQKLRIKKKRSMMRPFGLNATPIIRPREEETGGVEKENDRKMNSEQGPERMEDSLVKVEDGEHLQQKNSEDFHKELQRKIMIMNQWQQQQSAVNSLMMFQQPQQTNAGILHDINLQKKLLSLEKIKEFEQATGSRPYFNSGFLDLTKTNATPISAEILNMATMRASTLTTSNQLMLQRQLLLDRARRLSSLDAMSGFTGLGNPEPRVPNLYFYNNNLPKFIGTSSLTSFEKLQ